MKNLLFTILLLATIACGSNDPTAYKSFNGDWHYEDANGKVVGDFTINGSEAYATEFILYNTTTAIHSTQLILDADNQPSRLILTDATNRNKIDLDFSIKTFEKLDGQATLIVDGTPKSGFTAIKVRR